MKGNSGSKGAKSLIGVGSHTEGIDVAGDTGDLSYMSKVESIGGMSPEEHISQADHPHDAGKVMATEKGDSRGDKGDNFRKGQSGTKRAGK